MAIPSSLPISSNDVMQQDLFKSSQEIYRRRMSLDVPSSALMSTSSPEFQSLCSSPTFSRIPSLDLDYTSTYASTAPIPTQPSRAHCRNMALPEANPKPSEAGQQMKATLTELLNTDCARSDARYRAWIQCQLMNAEHSHRQEKRRRSSGSTEREFASSIAEHMEFGLHGVPKTWS